MSGNFLMINGKILHVINSNVEVEDGDRIRWSIVTEELAPAEVMRMMYETMPGMPPVAPAPAEVQPAAPADATVARSVEECPGGESCHGHQELFRNSGPAAPPVPRLDGPPLLAARSTYVSCMGEECTGCSDPQCWTVRASGGDA